MSTTIEARAVISAEDKTGAAFASVEKKLKGLGKAAKTSTEIDRLSKSLDLASQKMKALDRAERVQTGFERSRTAMRRAGDALSVYNKAMADTARASPGMAVAQARAQVSFDRAMNSYKRQRDVLSQSAAALRSYGLSTGNIATEQSTLRRSVEATTQAIARQNSAARRGLASREAAAHHMERHGVVHAALGAAAGAVSIHSISGAIGHTVQAGARYQHEVTALENAGQREHIQEIQEAAKAAVTTVPTSTYSENLQVINETTQAFGSLHHAIENLPFMQKTAAVVHAAAGDKVPDTAGELGQKFAKFFELRQNAGNTEDMQREAKEMVRAILFTRGNFNPNGMVHFAQMTAANMPNYSLRFLSRVVPSLSTEFGERTGDYANAFNNVILGKANDSKQAEAWKKTGLIDPKKMVVKGGHAVSWEPDAIYKTRKALSDPDAFMKEDVLPSLRKLGVNTDDSFEVTKWMNVLFRNQGSNRFANALSQKGSISRLEKDADLNENTSGLDESYQRLLKEDPTVALKAFAASLDNVMTTLSSPAMSTAATGLTALAGGVNTLASALSEHPNLAMIGGAGAATGAAAGAGWMTYQLANGFGLKGSAVALDGAAGALTEAAAALGGAGALKKIGPGLLPELAAPGLLARIGGAAARTGGVAAPLVMLRELGEAHRPMTPAGAPYRLDQAIDPGTWERAQRGVMEQRLDPEGRRGREMMRAFGPGVPDGPGGGAVRAELTGSAEVRGETTVKVEVFPSGQLLETVAKADATARLQGTLTSGSAAGVSMPHYAAPAIKAGPR